MYIYFAWVYDEWGKRNKNTTYRGDKESDGNYEVFPSTAGEDGSSKEKGDDCAGMNRLNDGWIATVI